MYRAYVWVYVLYSTVYMYDHFIMWHQVLTMLQAVTHTSVLSCVWSHTIIWWVTYSYLCTVVDWLLHVYKLIYLRISSN